MLPPYRTSRFRIVAQKEFRAKPLAPTPTPLLPSPHGTAHRLQYRAEALLARTVRLEDRAGSAPENGGPLKHDFGFVAEMRQISYKSNAKTTPPPRSQSRRNLPATQRPPRRRATGTCDGSGGIEEKGKGKWKRETSGNIVWRNWWAARDLNSDCHQTVRCALPRMLRFLECHYPGVPKKIVQIASHVS